MRDQDIDSIKGLLIFLVVLGHFLEKSLGWGDEFNRVLLSSIYFIHMPAFIFISGMFFKAQGIGVKLIYFLSLLIPFQIAYLLFNVLLNDQVLNSQIFTWTWLEVPYWILWYLLGMIAWSILMPLLSRMAFPVLISIILSLVIGFSIFNNYLYSIGRIFTFLPFFVIGHLYGQQLFKHIKNHHLYMLLGLSVLGMIIYISMHLKVSNAWLYGSYSFDQLGVDSVTGIVKRMMIFTISLSGIFAILSFTPMFRKKLVSLGQHTLAVYLLHGFIVITITHYITFPQSFSYNIFVCIFLSIMSCWVLQLNIFMRLINTMTSILTRK